jgi:hypothetical protein
MQRTQDGRVHAPHVVTSIDGGFCYF